MRSKRADHARQALSAILVSALCWSCGVEGTSLEPDASPDADVPAPLYEADLDEPGLNTVPRAHAVCPSSLVSQCWHMLLPTPQIFEAGDFGEDFRFMDISLRSTPPADDRHAGVLATRGASGEEELVLMVVDLLHPDRFTVNGVSSPPGFAPVRGVLTSPKNRPGVYEDFHAYLCDDETCLLFSSAATPEIGGVFAVVVGSEVSADHLSVGAHDDPSVGAWLLSESEIRRRYEGVISVEVDGTVGFEPSGICGSSHGTYAIGNGGLMIELETDGDWSGALVNGEDDLLACGLAENGRSLIAGASGSVYVAAEAQDGVQLATEPIEHVAVTDILSSAVSASSCVFNLEEWEQPCLKSVVPGEVIAAVGWKCEMSRNTAFLTENGLYGDVECIDYF